MDDEASELIQAIITGKSDIAMYLTCFLVHKDRHEELENVFIEATARVGEHEDMPFLATWQDVNARILALIQIDNMNIIDVLSITTMLTLLHKRLTPFASTEVKKKPSGHGKLRKQILDHFPEKARLAYKGIEMFDGIINKEPEDLHAFQHRLLAGFSRLLEQKMSDELRMALMYLSKRKLQLPMPNVWPAPDEETAKQGDPIWMLWGMLLLYFRNEFVATNFQLFCSNWKKKWKSKRLGLLYGVAYNVREGNHMLLWSKHEEMVLAKIREMAPELWQNCLVQWKEEAGESEPEVSFLDHFEPRGTRTHMHSEPQDIVKPAPKVVDIRQKDKLDLRQKITKIKKVDASSYIDSRYRGVDFSS